MLGPPILDENIGPGSLILCVDVTKLKFSIHINNLCRDHSVTDFYEGNENLTT